MLMIMYIFICLWKVGYNGKNEICNYSYIQMIYYLLITETIALSKMNNITTKISDEVKSGLIAYNLNKPFNYIIYHFFNELGATFPKIIINLSVGFIVIWIVLGSCLINFIGLVISIISVLLSICIDYCFSILIGLISFKMEDVSGINMIYQKINQIFGGLFIPLSFLPIWMGNIAKVLPFSAIYNLPAELYTNFSFDNVISVFAKQGIWIVIMSVVLLLFYKHNIKYLSLNGG